MIANCLGINEAGHLEISGCDTVRLAEQYGTPLYVCLLYTSPSPRD